MPTRAEILDTLAASQTQVVAFFQGLSPHDLERPATASDVPGEAPWRADSGFALPRLSRFCDRENIVYPIGLATSSRLTTLAQDLLAAIAQQKAADVPKIRLAGEASCAAASWDKARRIVYKAEALPKGPNTRFVVTTRNDPPLALYDFYVQRGTPAQWIDQLKATCFADRLSCCDFWPNQFRLLLSAATYWLLHTLRSWLERAQIVPIRLETVRVASCVGDGMSGTDNSLQGLRSESGRLALARRGLRRLYGYRYGLSVDSTQRERCCASSSPIKAVSRCRARRCAELLPHALQTGLRASRADRARRRREGTKPFIAGRSARAATAATGRS
jgi:hypothetical protein